MANRASQADIVDRIRDVATGLSEPSLASEVAAFADVAPGAAEIYLQHLVERGLLLAVDDGAGTVYCPDPTTAFVDGLDALCSSVLAGDPDSARQAVADWWDGSDVETVEDLWEYHVGGRLVVGSRCPVGRHVYEDDWDVLVVLDTCRVDALRAVVDRIDGAEDVESRVSLGSQTAEWLCQTFTDDRREEVASTGYVAGNGWGKAVFEDGLRPDDDLWYEGMALPTAWDVVDGEDFGALVHAWRREHAEYTTDVPWTPHPSPRTVTDHAIALARDRPDLDRLVVHYKQPHAPYTLTAQRQGRDALARYERAPFEYLRTGGDREAVLNAYRRDLEATVEEVEVLRRNVDGRLAITADHGEAFGEFGAFGHRPTMLHPHVRRVPWISVDATDEGAHHVDRSAYRTADRDVEDQLEALGYL